MFTGIIQQIGTLVSKETIGESRRLSISTQAWDPPLKEGESVAVNGVCLTVVRLTKREFACDLLAETIACSNLDGIKPGGPLNLERALKAGEPLGGHFISGHVDGTGTIIKQEATGGGRQMDIACESKILRYLVLKGSVACDGVSLTVSGLEKTFFSVNLIPYTQQNTTLPSLKEGDLVNLETDMIGKFVFRLLEQGKNTEPITIEHFRRAGFTESY